MSLDAFKTISGGMDASPARAPDRGCVPAAVPVVSLAGRIEPRLRTGYGRSSPGRLPGRGRLVDGGVGLANRVEVSQYRLAFHLTLAALIYVALLWAAQWRVPRSGTPVPWRLRSSAKFLLALVLVQIYLGALVAGLRAGLIYNTWPLIDGRLAPAHRSCGSRAMVAQSLRESADRAIRPSAGGLCVVSGCDLARGRCGAGWRGGAGLRSRWCWPAPSRCRLRSGF